MPSTLSDSVLDGLVEVLDEIRTDLVDIVGDKQWRLFQVTRTWTGDERGAGDASEVEVEILPRPLMKVAGSYSLQSEGVRDNGSVTATEVSLTYTEAELDPVVASNQEVFYRTRDGQGQGIAFNDYRLAGSPTPDRVKNLGWVIELTRIQKQAL